MNQALRLILLLSSSLSLVAGCLAPGKKEPPLPLSCVAGVCLADPESPDSQLALKQSGFRQLTVDNSRFGNIHMEGDFVVWQRYNGTASKIYGYNFTTNRLIEIADEPHRILLRPYVSHGIVVYGAEDWVETWNKNDLTVRKYWCEPR